MTKHISMVKSKIIVILDILTLHFNKYLQSAWKSKIGLQKIVIML